MPEVQHIIHPIPPFYDSTSKILILGSFPSVKTRESGFFYGHPQNRFWPLMTALFREEKVPKTIDEKADLLRRHHIALWDSIHECDIIGSSDSSIKNAVPNDISMILEAADIRPAGGIADRVELLSVDHRARRHSAERRIPPGTHDWLRRYVWRTQGLF